MTYAKRLDLDDTGLLWFDDTIIAEVSQTGKQAHDIIEAANEALQGIEYFCEQVECGNFHSKNTYKKFKDTLIKAGWRKE